MLKRNIVHLEGDFDSTDDEAKEKHTSEVPVASDRGRRSQKRHVLLKTLTKVESKRPRPSYVDDKLHEIFAEIGVLEAVDELTQLQNASNRPTVVRVREAPENPENDRVEVRYSPFNGLGVYVKENEKVETGEVLSQFPGPPRWVQTDRRGEIPLDEITEYVFAIGPFKIKGRYSRYSIVWGTAITTHSDYHGPCRGHLINSSHPLLKHPRNCTNCVYGVFYDNLVLDIDIPPDITLYAVCARPIVGGAGPDPLYELRTEYHWCLAYHFGFWCLNRTCMECLSAIRDFANRHIPLLE